MLKTGQNDRSRRPRRSQDVWRADGRNSDRSWRDAAGTRVDARKSYAGCRASRQRVGGLEPGSGHWFVFIYRRGHVGQTIFWDRNGFCIVKKRLEAGTFKLARGLAPDATHVEIDS